MKSITKEEINKILKDLDKKLTEKDEGYLPAQILLASAFVGTSKTKITKILNYPIGILEPYVKNIKRGGIWKNNKVHCNWLDEKHGGIAFWSDVLVAQGYLNRVKKE